jgi:hypothetical protein
VLNWCVGRRALYNLVAGIVFQNSIAELRRLRRKAGKTQRTCFSQLFEEPAWEWASHNLWHWKKDHSLFHRLKQISEPGFEYFSAVQGRIAYKTASPFRGDFSCGSKGWAALERTSNPDLGSTRGLNCFLKRPATQRNAKTFSAYFGPNTRTWNGILWQKTGTTRQPGEVKSFVLGFRRAVKTKAQLEV